MSAGAVASQAGSSSSASKDKKSKRIRKRSRNKKRTTEVDDSSSSSSDSSSDESDDEEPVKKAAPVEKVKPSSNKAPAKDSKVQEPDSDSSDDEDGEGGKKRKRKRTRTTKKKTVEDVPEPAAPTAPLSAPTRAKVFTVSPEDVGPDPNTDLRLSDQAKQAIQYAQLYTKDKSQWKFNKAKQNWLLRNALAIQPSDYDAALARKQPDSTASAEGVAEEAEEADEGENFVPEDFVPVVTAYLSSVVGGARQRLVESLKEAVNAPAITVAPRVEASDDTANAEATNGDAANAETKGSATKSVSFGNLALEAEKKEEAAEAAGLPTGTDPRTVELRRTRASQMLQKMGESL